MNHGASSAANPEKGARYLAQLDQALCSASWSEIPELARKVEKHAPTRRCLTLAARSEAQIASASHRPTSASSNSTASLHGLSELIPRLEEAIVVGNSIEEDAFIASVGLAEIHWLREDQETALKLLPDFVPESNTHSSLPSALGWMEVCAVKTSYIRAASLESQGKQEQAQKLYQEAIARTPGTRSTELRKWTERLLARACMHFDAQTSSQSSASITDALRAFTVWNDFWQRSPPGTPASGDHPSRIDIPTRQVWHAYYNLLSTILQKGHAYHIAHGRIHIGAIQTFPEEFRAPSKHTQRADLKRVESTYESLLIQETQFPKASQTNHEVEQWIEHAMKNWRIFCGFGWTDAELGQGGKEKVSRTMLDILYRAATKTFHSTAVLRELFHVHASLGEFDLAMHAFDSYVDIVGKGKARAQKTGHHQDGIDDDDTAVLTGVEAVRVLCRYGDRSKAEKAVAVGKNLQRWLGEGRPRSSEQTTVPSGEQKTITDQRANAHLKATTLAAAYRAIGISQAQWARMTYDTDARPGLQAEALRNLRRAEAQDPDDIETCYALSSLLAETRDVTAAISSIRRILAIKPDNQAEGEDGAVKDYRRPRKLVPLWHLLALCLSAKGQHEAAYKMCEAALEQFGDRTVLFGQGASLSEKIESLGENIEKRSDAPAPSIGLVDQMDGFEKEVIIQIKMTQLAFAELMDGPSSAVDMTDELLSLYARLFGRVEQVKVPKPLPAAPAAAPSRTGGTLRSIAGSIRPRTNRNSVDKSGPRVVSHGTTLEPPAVNGHSNTPSSQDLGPPIAITVTNEDGAPVDRGRGRQEHRNPPFRLRSSTRGTNGRSRSRSLGGKSKPVPADSDHPPLPPPKDFPTSTATAGTANQNPVTSAVDNGNSQQPLKSMAHNKIHTEWPAPAGHDNQPPEQDVRLPAPHPASSTTPMPSFSSAQQQRHKVSVLVKVWLFIAELYIRAESLDDASGAIQEAHKLVESFEAEVAAIESSARAFYSKTWGGGSSVDELWADILSSRGDLASARDLHFEASSHYEESLFYFPDHPSSIISLSSQLLDIYSEKMPAEPPQPLLPTQHTTAGTAPHSLALSSVPSHSPSTSRLPATTPVSASASIPPHSTNPSPSSSKDPAPAELNRLAARERAYMLLSGLTRLGSGWDDSEAWLELARAHELSGQVGKAKEALWWVVKLEETRPTRGWRDAAVGGLAL